MERLTIDEMIAHCDRQLGRLPSGTKLYQEHESTRAYLQILRHYRALGTVEHLTELVRAQSEGRVVALPCKVGTTVYVNRECLFPVMTYGNYRMEPCEVIAFSRTRKQILAKITTHKAQAENCRYSKKFPVSAFGKTVFLTRAEAEAALGGGGGE